MAQKIFLFKAKIIKILLHSHTIELNDLQQFSLSNLVGGNVFICFTTILGAA